MATDGVASGSVFLGVVEERRPIALQVGRVSGKLPRLVDEAAAFFAFWGAPLDGEDFLGGIIAN
jgi:hypothetical protein